MTALLLVHGRSQQMPVNLDRSDTGVAAYVADKKRGWLAGLARGLVLAGHEPVAGDDAYFPFYGNVLSDMIARHEADGGGSPDLEDAQIRDAIPGMTDDLAMDAARQLGFRASRRLARSDPQLVDEAIRAETAAADGLEFGLSDLLKRRFAREALQFLSDKTGIPEWIIERYLRDVAYYLEDDVMRARVLAVVRRSIDDAVADGHTDLVVIGHSLGSVVAYDTCSDLGTDVPVRLLVTAGSPLGHKVVRRNLHGGREGSDRRAVPAVIDPPPGGPGRDRVWWLNAYDVLDVVALVHPIAPRFSQGREKIRDERTHNPSGPHSIPDYLSDVDVAGPIGDAMTGPAT